MLSVEKINKIYEESGFDGVIGAVADRLECGFVRYYAEDEIFCIITRGWSNDESVIYNLLDPVSIFGQNHYVGYIRGGAYYVAQDSRCHYRIVPNSEGNFGEEIESDKLI